MSLPRAPVPDKEDPTMICVTTVTFGPERGDRILRESSGCSPTIRVGGLPAANSGKESSEIAALRKELAVEGVRTHES
jgi:hypothetical protein